MGRSTFAVLLRGVALGTALTAITAPLSAWAAIEPPLRAADGMSNDNFGIDVAVDGDIAVVGAPDKDDGRGAVYVFVRQPGGWTQTGKLLASDITPLDNLGRSVAIDGDTIVAGAPNADVPGAPANAGVVYTFSTTGPPTRYETAKLIASDYGSNSAYLGGSVAIDGDTIVAGAVTGRSYIGAAYTFAASGAALRTETSELTASDAAVDDGFGATVAIDGPTIAVGAPKNGPGAVYLFARTGPPTRHELPALVASDGRAGDRLGGSLALRGESLLVGAGGADVAGVESSGAVYDFERSATSGWRQVGKLAALNPVYNERLGASVAVEDGIVVAGAPGPGSPDFGEVGAAYTFTAEGPATRSELERLQAPAPAVYDLFGWSVAGAGDELLIGVPNDRANGNLDQGAVMRFRTPPVPPDVDPPALTLRVDRRQRLGRPLLAHAICDEDCELIAGGRVWLAGRRNLRLREARVGLMPDQPASIRLELSRRLRRVIAKSGDGRGRARVRVAAADTAGNLTVRRAKVVLRSRAGA